MTPSPFWSLKSDDEVQHCEEGWCGGAMETSDMNTIPCGAGKNAVVGILDLWVFHHAVGFRKVPFNNPSISQVHTSRIRLIIHIIRIERPRFFIFFPTLFTNMFNGRNLHQIRFFKIYPLELRLFQLLSALAMSLFEKSTRTFQRMHVTKKFKSVSPVSPWSTPPVNGYSQPTPPSAPTYHRRKPGFNDNQPYFFLGGGEVLYWLDYSHCNFRWFLRFP